MSEARGDTGIGDNFLSKQGDAGVGVDLIDPKDKTLRMLIDLLTVDMANVRKSLDDVRGKQATFEQVQESKLKGIEKSVAVLSQSAEESRKLSRGVLEELKEARRQQLRSIEYISLFVSFLTFVSSEALLFQQEMTLFAASGFTLIFLAGLLTFVLVVHLLIEMHFEMHDDGAEEWYKKLTGKMKSLFMIVIMLFLLGIVLVSTGNKMRVVHHYSPDQKKIYMPTFLK